MRLPGGCDWRQRCFTLTPCSVLPSHYKISGLRPIFLMLFSVVKVEKKKHWQCQDPKKKGNVHSSVLPWRKQCRRLKQWYSRERQCKLKLDQDKKRSARWDIWLTLEISQQYLCQITLATSDSTLLLHDAVVVHHSCNRYKLACLLRAVIVRFCLYNRVTTVKACYVIQFLVQTVG